MNISDEAVEAATQRLIESMSQERDLESPYVDAEDPGEAVLDGVFDLPAIVRTVLEAAAPHLMAQAWDEGVRVGESGWCLLETPCGECANCTTPGPSNPYRNEG